MIATLQRGRERAEHAIRELRRQIAYTSIEPRFYETAAKLLEVLREYARSPGDLGRGARSIITEAEIDDLERALQEAYREVPRLVLVTPMEAA